MTPTANLVKKFKLAEFRYGKEELLQLFVDSAELPADMPPLPPISNVQSSSPLAFVPQGADEQVG
jgi:PERQ amino acid-rich with GYF domain-containing protein